MQILLKYKLILLKNAEVCLEFTCELYRGVVEDRLTKILFNP